MNKKHVLLENGETIHYLEQGNGPTVLILIHGNLSSGVYFKPLLEKLPENIKVYAPDLRGFGDSSYHQQISSLKELALDVKLFMDQLQISQAHLLGWSLGGGVAMEFAALYPEAINSLILMNSTTHKGYPIFKKDATGKPVIGEVYQSSQELANDPVQVKPMIDAINAKNGAIIKYVYDLLIYTNNKPNEEDYQLFIAETLKQRNLADVDYALATLNMSNQPNFYRQGDNTISNIKCPVLHFWGINDKTVLEYMVLENINALENSKYVRFEDCGHSPIVDKLDELTKEILAFIQ